MPLVIRQSNGRNAFEGDIGKSILNCRACIPLISLRCYQLDHKETVAKDNIAQQHHQV